MGHLSKRLCDASTVLRLATSQALDEYGGLTDCGNGVDGLAGARVVLLNCDDAASFGVQDAVSKSELALRRQRLGRLHRGTCGLPVQALVPAMMSRINTSAHIVVSGRSENFLASRTRAASHTSELSYRHSPFAVSFSHTQITYLPEATYHYSWATYARMSLLALLHVLHSSVSLAVTAVDRLRLSQ